MSTFHLRYSGVSKIFQIVLYSLAVAFGLVTLLWPVPAISGVIGLHLVYAYALLLIGGGIGALYGVIKPNYKIELGFMWPVASGWAIYDLSLWGVYLDRLVHPSIVPPAYGPAIAVLCLTIFYAWMITYLSLEARKLLKAVDNAGIS